jgi:signal transduction histidine kinase
VSIPQRRFLFHHLPVHLVRVPMTTTQATDLVDRLTTHDTLGVAPRSELEWLVANSEWRRYEPGTVLVKKDQMANEMFTLLSGRIAVHFDHGTGRRHVMESRAGGVTGVLPFSRIGVALGDAVAEEALEALALHRDLLPALIRECPTITATLVHVMVDRARSFSATNWQDEKMASLGRLAAGLAHELNNPAAAAASSARRLSGALVEMGEAAGALGRASLSDAQRTHVATFLSRCLGTTPGGARAAIEQSDREDQIATWLESHRANTAPAPALAESGASVQALDELSAAIGDASLDAALGWVASACTARSLTTDVERATGRISDLVASVKRFTYMDRAGVAQPTDLALGLRDTMSVLAAKARTRSITVTLDVPSDLPLVPGSTADLNQVWMNLLENALDAARPSGEVIVRAGRDGGFVVVRVMDDGAGIPPALLDRIFDPFFTTKGVGEGSGLGLDIARRIVRMHEGQIEVESRPGRTEFRVRIPVGPASGA